MEYTTLESRESFGLDVPNRPEITIKDRSSEIVDQSRKILNLALSLQRDLFGEPDINGCDQAEIRCFDDAIRIISDNQGQAICILEKTMKRFGV